MAVFHVREIHKNGVPLGRFRLTGKDEDGWGGREIAMCDCAGGHETRDEALSCEKAKKTSETF